jgi:hypothetical protein
MKLILMLNVVNSPRKYFLNIVLYRKSLLTKHLLRLQIPAIMNFVADALLIRN